MLPLATKTLVTGRNPETGKKQKYSRYTIEGHGDTLFSFGYVISPNDFWGNTGPKPGDVHARYGKHGQCEGGFYVDPVPGER